MYRGGIRFCVNVMVEHITFPERDHASDKLIKGYTSCVLIGKVAHLLVIRWLEKHRVGCAPLSVHDSVLVDCRWPVERAPELEAAIRPLMEEHWFIRELYEHFGRRVAFPVDFEVMSGYD